MNNKERYKQNSKRVKEIYGYDANDRSVNVHHIIFRADYKRRKEFWDASVPSERFDIDGRANLCPLPIEVHAELHIRIDLPQISPKKKRKKKRRRR